jgi:hypothetical protein
MEATLIKSEDSYILKDGLNHVLGIDDKKLKDRLECLYLLSKQNCDEIFGVIDVEKLAENKYGKGIYEIEQVDAYIEGFNKAMELNKDKVFTLEDMKKAYSQGELDALKTGSYSEKEKEFIQSLQQPTEIEVEIVMENYGYCEGCRKAGMWHCAHADTCGNAENRERPKLDSSGNLILKKI